MVWNWNTSVIAGQCPLILCCQMAQSLMSLPVARTPGRSVCWCPPSTEYFAYLQRTYWSDSNHPLLSFPLHLKLWNRIMKQEAQRATYRAPEYNVPPFLTDWPGRPSCFSDRPKKHKLGRGRWDLSSCQVSLNSIQRFQRRSRKCLSQSEARAAILFFRSAQKTQTW